MIGWYRWPGAKPKQDKQLCAVWTPGALMADVWPARWDAKNQNFEAGGGWFEGDEIKAWYPLPEPPNV